MCCLFLPMRGRDYRQSQGGGKEASWDTLAEGKKLFGMSEKRMIGRMLGRFICGKGQKEKGTGAVLNHMCNI